MRSKSSAPVLKWSVLGVILFSSCLLEVRGFSSGFNYFGWARLASSSAPSSITGAETWTAAPYKSRISKSALLSSPNNNHNNNHHNNDSEQITPSPLHTLFQVVQTNPSKSAKFSVLMTLCGASLGPFLDSYHSLFGVLSYNTPLVLPLLGSIDGQSPDLLTCVTTYWVPPLFGLAGFLIGWLYIWLDAVFFFQESNDNEDNYLSILHPPVPKVLVGISYFTFQYWLSGILSAHGMDRTSIMNIMSVLAAGGFLALDGTLSGFITSAATAIGGPLIEVGLISILPTLGDNGGAWAYHYNDAGETGFFPLWIVPVYFLGGPANGNLARAFWNALGEGSEDSTTAAIDSDDKLLPPAPKKIVPCSECQGTRAVACPNCDDGTYVTYGQRVVCNACRGKGRVICRSCFFEYDTPNDLESVRKVMDKIPD